MERESVCCGGYDSAVSVTSAPCGRKLRGEFLSSAEILSAAVDLTQCKEIAELKSDPSYTVKS